MSATDSVPSMLMLDGGVLTERGIVTSPGWRGKRVLDVVGAFLLIVLFLPLMAVVALAVKLTSPGPVFFRQLRVGRHGRHFGILKFRTMVEDSEKRLAQDPELYRLYVERSHKLACHVDPRVTRVGRMLRTWSIDELPQVFNVLAGHMSLVGPRPVVPSELANYGEHADAYLALRPGLTGLWQVSGRSAVAFPERAHIDVRYGEACTPWHDLKLLARTPLAVLMRRGSD